MSVAVYARKPSEALLRSVKYHRGREVYSMRSRRTRSDVG